MERKYCQQFSLEQPIDTVFPLFSPEGERKWVPEWDYAEIRGCNPLTEDAVFLTRHHDHAAEPAIWLVKRYEPQTYFVEYYKVEPESKISIIQVSCTHIAPRTTRITVCYEYIGLTQAGNEFIASFTETDYADYIREWEGLLKSYFKSQKQ